MMNKDIEEPQSLLNIKVRNQLYFQPDQYDKEASN